MPTTREQKLRKQYDYEDRKISRMMDRFSAKYGRNWTKYTLTSKESMAFMSALRRQKRAIDKLVELDVKSGRLKKIK